MNYRNYVASIEILCEKCHSSIGYVFRSVCGTKNFVLTAKHSICLSRNICTLVTEDKQNCRKCKPNHSIEKIKIKTKDLTLIPLNIEFSTNTDVAFVEIEAIKNAPKLTRSNQAIDEFNAWYDLGEKRWLFNKPDLHKDGLTKFNLVSNVTAELKTKEEELTGCSGGLIFKVNCDEYFAEAIITEDGGGNDVGAELLTDNLVQELNKLANVQLFEEIYSQGDCNGFKKFDSTAATQWDITSPTDIRNLPDKINSVCKEVQKERIMKYCRDIASGKLELEKLPDREVSAMKFRIFEVCQEELLSFLEKQTKAQLTISEIQVLLESYTNKAVEIIAERSKDYNYPIRNKDTIRKIVLALIDECYLAFDWDGCYS